jgi:hypothetical protein
VALALAGAWGGARADPVVLEYVARYDGQSGEPDHIVNAKEVLGGRAIVVSNLALTLVDLGRLPPGGTQAYVHRLEGLNARDVYTEDGVHFYVHLARQDAEDHAGFAVVRLSGGVLQEIGRVHEPLVLYEKLCVRDGFLYVAAHAHGLRIFSLADPLAPILTGSLEQGLTDAFAVDVAGDLAYVADGAGGLKVVDVTDRAEPLLVAGETVESAVGTAEDVSVRDGRVYVAAGGAGLAVYEAGDPARRTLVDLGDGCAEGLAWIGERLAVNTLGGFAIVEVTGDEPPRVVAGETVARRGPAATLRLASGIAAASGDRVLSADWNYLDIYRVVPAAQGSQPDITPDVQRIRFAPEGGVQAVTLRNDGAAPLTISGATCTHPAFATSFVGSTLLPGEAVSFDVAYDGSVPASGVVLFQSDDPDENPLPVQLFGETQYLDPGEYATEFTLPIITRDPDTGSFVEDTFTLAHHREKVVWFQIYASW